MRVETLLRALFIFYCAEAGAFLLMAPWSALWDRSLFQIPSLWLQAVYFHPLFRGAITGLGAIHILWGAHDLEDWLLRRKEARS
ncbi:MAG: hypothetical protein ACE5GX_16825 [Thermoanaerobaculia bacterium]